ncbi:hypothetical protein, partial [Yoonia sp.]|uniref:hypothetical protein n=1 Tax=Yoonia sp. TaxID=2212373 RepID=UPI003976BA2A
CPALERPCNRCVFQGVWRHIGEVDFDAMFGCEVCCQQAGFIPAGFDIPDPAAFVIFDDIVSTTHSLPTQVAALEETGALPDAAWMAGMIRLRREEFDRAKSHFEHALARLYGLGELFAKYEIAAQISLPITEDIFAHVFPRERGTRLALVEIAQLQGSDADAMVHIERLRQIDATDPIVLLSFAELALDTPNDRALMDDVVRATTHVENETPVDTAILLYRGRALSAMDMPDAAIGVFTLANRRRKNRPEGLLHQIRYDRAVLYEQVGRKAQARREFERLYAEDPGFEDVRARLNL